MDRYSSVGTALDALQAQADALERDLAQRTAELEAAQHQLAIEAALDRVAAQARVVDHAEEAGNLAASVFDEVRALGVPVLQIDLAAPPAPGEAAHPGPPRVAVWSAGLDASGHRRTSQALTTLAGHPVLEAMATAGGHGEATATALAPEAYRAFLHASLAAYPPSHADRVLARAPRADAYHVAYVPPPAAAVRAGTSGFLVAILRQPPSPDDLSLLARFAAVFGAAQERYGDAEHALAQAQTLRVAAALDRVRARVPAMRSSADFAGVVEALVAEMHGLGVETVRVAAALVDGPAGTARFWVADPRLGAALDPTTAPLAGHPLLNALAAAWRQQRRLSYILEGADRTAFYRLRTGTVPPGAREYVHAVPTPSGVLMAYAPEPFADDTAQVVEQLAKVFHAAGTRYGDLQKSEARARDAAQQAAADRLRAEIASMRTAADLDAVTPRLWQELRGLGVPADRCAIAIVAEDESSLHVLPATLHGTSLPARDVPAAVPAAARLLEAWRTQTVLHEAPDPDVPDGLLLPPDAAEIAPPQAVFGAPFMQGVVLVGSPAPLDAADGAAVRALADAFEVAYARYDDFRRLEAKRRELEAALADLHAAQQQLVESEKLASLGALTAGIAHEIKNPLNFVINFASLSRELVEEITQDLGAGVAPDDLADLMDDLRSNVEKIEGHGRRADSIVRGMMQHARGGEAQRETADVNALVEEYVNLAYHGRRAQQPDFSVTMERDYAPDAGDAQLVPQDVGRVIINLVGNAFDAVTSRRGTAGPDYVPTVRVATQADEAAVTISVSDNGTGMPEAVRARIFEPFYTTKPPGAGTGLGLSMSHDIVVHRHGGRLAVESVDGEGTTFTITLPR